MTATILDFPKPYKQSEVESGVRCADIVELPDNRDVIEKVPADNFRVITTKLTPHDIAQMWADLAKTHAPIDSPALRFIAWKMGLIE